MQKFLHRLNMSLLQYVAYNFFFIIISFFKKFLKTNILIIYLLLIQPSFADPFSSGDVVLGQGLHNQNCKSCHDGMVPGGNGNDLYLFELRAISSSAKLHAQVEFCANQNGLTWFEDEIVSVSKFLNVNFYKFSN